MHVAVELAGTAQAEHEAPQLATEALLRHAEPHVWKPAEHTKPHAPRAQVALPFDGTGHEVAQLLQCVASVLTLTSQPSAERPSQSAKPRLHVKPHVAPLHVEDAFAGTGHAVQVPPHVAVLALLAHVPPQSWKPALQPKPHTPPVQVGTPFGGELHTVVHAPQWVVSVLSAISQPSAASPLQSE